jgi:hypothetical protein
MSMSERWERVNPDDAYSTLASSVSHQSGGEVLQADAG